MMGFDDGLAKALATPDPKKRSVEMEKLQKILQDEGIIIQPFWRSIYNHTRPNVKGAEVHQAFELHPDRVWLDQ